VDEEILASEKQESTLFYYQFYIDVAHYLVLLDILINATGILSIQIQTIRNFLNYPKIAEKFDEATKHWKVEQFQFRLESLFPNKILGSIKSHQKSFKMLQLSINPNKEIANLMQSISKKYPEIDSNLSDLVKLTLIRYYFLNDHSILPTIQDPTFSIPIIQPSHQDLSYSAYLLVLLSFKPENLESPIAEIQIPSIEGYQLISKYCSGGMMDRTYFLCYRGRVPRSKRDLIYTTFHQVAQFSCSIYEITENFCFVNESAISSNWKIVSGYYLTQPNVFENILVKNCHDLTSQCSNTFWHRIAYPIQICLIIFPRDITFIPKIQQVLKKLPIGNLLTLHECLTDRQVVMVICHLAGAVIEFCESLGKLLLPLIETFQIHFCL
jgi:hypothetical protein